MMARITVSIYYSYDISNTVAIIRWNFNIVHTHLSSLGLNPAVAKKTAISNELEVGS